MFIIGAETLGTFYRLKLKKTQFSYDWSDFAFSCRGERRESILVGPLERANFMS
jgi:hypothetical protein